MNIRVAPPSLVLGGAAASLVAAPSASGQILFETIDTEPTVRVPVDIGRGHLSGNAAPDVLAIETALRVTALANRGDGDLVDAGSVKIGSADRTVIVGVDLDGDHVDEVVWGTTDSLVLFDPDGEPGQRFAEFFVSAPVERITSGDFDLDGLDEVAIVTLADSFFSRPPQVHVLRGGGRGDPLRLDAVGTTVIEATRIPRLVTGDFDGDGDDDLAYFALHEDLQRNNEYYTAESGVVVLLNEQPGETFETRLVDVGYGYGYRHNSVLEGLQRGDVDGDGDVDLVFFVEEIPSFYYSDKFGNQVATLLNDGTGNFTLSEQETSEQFRGGDLADWNRDGDLDIVTLFNLNAPYIYAEWVDGTWLEGVIDVPLEAYEQFVRADVDGDGAWDGIVRVRDEPAVRILRNATPPGGPRLVVPDLIAGSSAEFMVEGVAPTAEVDLLFSLEDVGHGKGRSEYGGIVLDLEDPVTLVGSATADGAGIATIEATLPPGARGRIIHFQAVERAEPRGIKTGFVSRRVR